MRIFNSSARYGAIAVSLHWSAVVLVVLAWTLGIFGDDLARRGNSGCGSTFLPASWSSC
jgi:cytochrome b561